MHEKIKSKKFWRKRRNKQFKEGKRVLNFFNLISKFLSLTEQAKKQKIALHQNLLFLLICLVLSGTVIILEKFVVQMLWPFPPFIIFDKTLIISVLLGIIGVDGVFLALFFSAETTVFSSTYSKAPYEISQTFLKETAKDIKPVLADFSMSIMFLLCELFFWDMGIVSISIYLLVSLITVCSFFVVGYYAFFYSKICNIAYLINQKQIIIFKLIKNKKYHFLKKEYFYVFRDKEKEMCRYQEKLISLFDGSNTIMNIDDATIVSQYILSLLPTYVSTKETIPYSSPWFDSKYSYPSWFLSDFEKVSLSLDTSTVVPPNVALDRYWVEKNMLLTAFSPFRELKAEKNSSPYLSVALSKASESIKQSLRFDNLGFFIEVIETLKDLLTDKNGKSVDEVGIQAYCAMLVDYVLGVRGVIIKFDDFCIKIDESIALCKKNNGFLNKKFACFLNKDDVISLNTKILDEKRIDGKITTPDWYISSYLFICIHDDFLKIETDLVKAIMVLKNLLKEYKTKEERLYEATLLVYLREAIAKIDFIMPALQKTAEDFNKLRKDDSFVKKSISEVGVNYSQAKAEIEREMPDFFNDVFLLYKTGEYKKKDQNIDLLGYSYFNLLNDSEQRLESGNFDCFLKNVKAILNNSDLAEAEINKISEKTSDYNSKKSLANFVKTEIIETIGFSAFFCLATKQDENFNKISMVTTAYLSNEDTKKSFVEFCKKAKKDGLNFSFFPTDFFAQNMLIKYQEILKKDTRIHFQTKPTYGERVVFCEGNKLVNDFGYSIDSPEISFLDFFIEAFINPLLAEDEKIKIDFRGNEDEQR